jgi:hypothetical protein
MFMDDLSSKGYNTLTDTFLKRSEKDGKESEKNQHDLVEGLVYAKEEIKTAMFKTFYNTESTLPGRQVFE